ncbi:MAG: SpaA isopeptide-forming pilin-related protein [Coprobacillaceae bacterium]
MKKIMKLLLVILMSITTVIPSVSNIQAASYNVGQTFITGWNVATVPSEGLYGQVAKLSVDGREAWCLQANIPAHVGSNDEVDFSDIGISNDQASDISLIAYFGYRAPGMQNDDNYVLTQNLIWKYLGYSSYYYNSTWTVEKQNEWQNTVLKKVVDFNTNPNFGGASFTVNVGETINITDTNAVLNSMKVTDANGLNVSISGNSLSITGTVDAPEQAVIVLKPDLDESQLGTNFVVRNGNSQGVSVCNYRDPAEYRIRVKVNKYVDVNLSKVDSENKDFVPQGDASLVGSKFGVFDASNDQLLEEKVIDETGTIKFNQLWANMKYYIQEISAGEGYVLNGEKFHVDPAALLTSGTVGADLQYYMTVENHVMKQAFSIIKISSDGSSTETPTVAGAEFTAYLLSEYNVLGDSAPVRDVLITDDNGYALSKELPYGKYIVKETKTPVDLETARDFFVVIDKDSREPQVYRILNDAPYEAYVKIVKGDADTDETVVFDSLEIQIYDEQGNLYRQKVGEKWIDTFVTDETGTVTTPLKMKAGTYYIHEIKTPKGYLTLEEPLEFIITNQGAVEIDEDGDPILKVVIKNEKPTAKIVINKSFETLETEIEEDTEELTDDADVEEIETPEETKYAKFKVEVQSDIINPANGEVLYKKGDVISNPNSEDGLFMTDENMQVIIDGLPMGIDTAKFKVIEVETSDGYKLTDPIEVEFTQEDLTTKEYVYTIDVENKLYKPSIGTLATGINGEKILDPTIDNDIIDQIDYKDFDISKEYTLVTEFVCKETGEVIAGAKEENIVLDSIDGKYEVKLTIPANTVKDGDYYFREFFYTSDNPDTPYAEHNDENDEGQTIRFETPEQPVIPIEPVTPVTGDDTSAAAYVVLGMFALGGFYIVYRNNKKRKKLLESQEG